MDPELREWVGRTVRVHLDCLFGRLFKVEGAAWWVKSSGMIDLDIRDITVAGNYHITVLSHFCSVVNPNKDGR